MTRVVNASCLILTQLRRNIIFYVEPANPRKGLAGKAIAGKALAGRALAGKALAGKALAGKALAGKDLPCLPILASLKDIAHYVTCTTCRDATAAVRLESDCWKRIEIIPLLNVDTKELKSAENEFNLFNVRLTPKAGFHSIHF